MRLGLFSSFFLLSLNTSTPRHLGANRSVSPSPLGFATPASGSAVNTAAAAAAAIAATAATAVAALAGSGSGISKGSLLAAAAAVGEAAAAGPGEPAPVVSASAVPWTDVHHSDRREAWSFKRKSLSSATGLAAALGCSMIELPPGAGSRSWPVHWHACAEEAIYVLSGTGVAIHGGAAYPVKAGDYVSIPIGPSHAHQMVNARLVFAGEAKKKRGHC